jgi:hypothetical protein
MPQCPRNSRGHITKRVADAMIFDARPSPPLHSGSCTRRASGRFRCTVPSWFRLALSCSSFTATSRSRGAKQSSSSNSPPNTSYMKCLKSPMASAIGSNLAFTSRSTFNIGDVAAAFALHRAGIQATVYQRANELNRLVTGGRQTVTGILPARIFERNLMRVYSYAA